MTDADLLAEAERLQAVLAEHAARHDRETSFPEEGRELITRSPLNTALLDGASWQTFGRIVSILSRGNASFGTVWLMHQGSGCGFLALPDPAQVGFFAAEFRRGVWFGNALSEPTSGNMFLMPRQEARRVEGGWRLSGAKRFVSGCEHASYLLTNAVCDGQPAFFLIDKDASIQVEDIWDTMGMRATRSQLVHFHDTLLPESRRLVLDPTQPNAIAVGLPWISLGIAEAAMAFALEYARERKLPPDNRPLAEMQWIQFAVADMSIRLEAARSLAQRSAVATDRREPDFPILQMQAKVVANEAAVAIATAALELAGGSGYLRSRPIERYLRDAMSGPLMAWSPAVIRDFLGKALLGLQGPPA
ncbi:acyl-CoA dehydrogenase family protein [Vitiosangium sp. GDMCC 1.1324]|uniref:acyl-CoA dehydrogenase family protein n=1 Tax=Vitiosangium sp. (strain GDMCC 1.1324) TaxID=2138576 RepID=UPI000D3AAD0C|nr:acyl-CoA dehydrogenase family protein [Vitiosangium sp. GDMCC 1.1324]PTL84511.1 acyl-CoA dehydrogenase [Vitiosangium sp. GDMCC 1.1324]